MNSLLFAIENNNVRTLKLVIAVPGAVSSDDLKTAVLTSAKKGFSDALKILIDADTDVDVKDSKGMTPLLLAAEAGHVEVIDTLIRAKCDIHQKNLSGRNALHVACQNGRTECLKRLVEAGISINSQDRSKSTGLIISAFHRQTRCLQYLQKVGCNVNAQDSNGRTALHHATQKAVGVDVLLQNEGVDTDIVDKFGNTALMVAATEGFDNIVTSLIEANCDPDIVNSSGFAPIHFLAMKNHWRGIESIAHAHGDINICNGDNRQPLWYAVNHNRHEAIKSLLKTNCLVDPVNESDSADNVPLKVALSKGLYDVAKLLILAGCKLKYLYLWLEQYQQEKAQRELEETERTHLWDDDEEDSSSRSTDMMEEEEAYDWFQHWIHCPHTLRQLCRITVRTYIGKGFLCKAEELPLPQQIRDYVTLKEVEDYQLTGQFL